MRRRRRNDQWRKEGAEEVSGQVACESSFFDRPFHARLIGALVAAVRHRHRRVTPSPPPCAGRAPTTQHPSWLRRRPRSHTRPAQRLGKRRKVSRRRTDGRVVSFSLPPSLFLRILIPRRISPLISPFPIVLRAPPFLSPVVPPSALLIQLLPLMEGQERRGKKGEREREESPKTQTKLLPTD